MDTQTLGHFIGGEWTGADGALESRNPSNTDDVVARFPDGGAEERPKGRFTRALPASGLSSAAAERASAKVSSRAS